MKKYMLISIFAVIFLVTAAIAGASNDKNMTNAEFADVLVKVLDIDLPDNSSNLSGVELYRVQIEGLGDKDINALAAVNPGAFVTRGTLADAMYAALYGRSYLTTDEKLSYLAKSGYMKAGQAEEILDREEIIIVLNTPKIVKKKVEAYTPQQENRIIPPPKANPSGERPVSQI